MVDLRVMNNFADDKKSAIFENFARGIREVDRALDPITKAKLFRQAHRSIADRNDSTRLAHFLHNVTAIMRFDLLLNGGHHIRRAEVYLLARGCAARNQIRAHTLIGVILSAAKNLGLFWRPDGSKIVAKNVTRPSHKSYGLAGALLKMTQVRESGNAPQPGLIRAAAHSVLQRPRL